MLLTFIITQTNGKGEKSFSAKKTVNIGGANIESIAVEIAGFSKRLQDLIEYNKSKGFTSNFGMKKSLKTNIEIITEDYETVCELEFKNLGRFIAETDKETVTEVLEKNIEFAVIEADTEIDITKLK